MTSKSQDGSVSVTDKILDASLCVSLVTRFSDTYQYDKPYKYEKNRYDINIADRSPIVGESGGSFVIGIRKFLSDDSIRIEIPMVDMAYARIDLLDAVVKQYYVNFKRDDVWLYRRYDGSRDCKLARSLDDLHDMFVNAMKIEKSEIIEASGLHGNHTDQ